MTTLDTAIRLAVTAHAGQVDKAGEPYILHPLRVMLAMETEEERIVAVLHDVLEDGDYDSCNAVGDVVTDRQLDALEALTKFVGEPYRDYIERCASDPIAKRVKLADLRDNSDSARLERLDVQTRIRLIGKYDPAICRLQEGYWPGQPSPPEKVDG